MQKLTHEDFEPCSTLRQDIIVAIVFMVVSFSLMLFWSNKADEYVYRELTKPVIYEEE